MAISRELLDYIKEQLKGGLSKEEIEKVLLLNQWKEKDIKKAFATLEALETPTSFPSKDSFSLGKRVSSSHFKKPLLIFISLLFLFLIGGVAIYLYHIWPSYVLSKSIKEGAKVKQFAYSAKINLSFSKNVFSEEDLETSFLGPSPKISLNLDGAVDEEKKMAKTKFSLAFQGVNSAQSISPITVELRSFNKKSYIKFSQLPDYLLFFDLTFFKNKWIKVDNKKLGADFQYSPKLEQKVNDIVLKDRPIKVISRLSQEKIEGEKSYHYGIVPDDATIKKTIIDIANAVGGSLSPSDKKEIEQDLKKLPQPLSKLVKGEIWVGEKTYLPRKFHLFTRLLDDKGKEVGQLTLDVFFKDYNKSFQLEVPQNALPLEELMNEWLGQSLGQSF